MDALRWFRRKRLPAAGFLWLALAPVGVLGANDAISLSAVEREWLRRHPSWRVVGSASPPFQWIDEKGVYRGMGADYDALISKRLGTTVRAIPAISWTESLRQLWDGRCDACTMMIYTPERAQFINFTKELMELPTVALVRANSPLKIASAADLGGKTVSVPRSWAIHEQLQRDYPSIKLEPQAGVGEALMAVSNGSVDAYVGDLASTSYTMEKLGITNLKVACMMPYTYSLRIGVRGDWPELVPILDRVIDTISEKERREIFSRWVSVRMEGWTLEQVLQIAVPLSLVAGVFALGIYVRGLRREVQMRRAAEQAVLDTQNATIVALAALAETRDEDTGAHLERTSRYVGLLAEELRRQGWGGLTELDVDLFSKTAPLHDIGKVGIPDHILNKPGKLDAEEFAVMQTHTTLGAQALEKAGESCPGSVFLRRACEIALSHHEKWDGTGYPQRLKGEAISPGGRIMSVADVYDALRSKRVYKPSMSHEQAVKIIREGSGRAFDPAVVRVFEDLAAEFERISVQLADRANQGPEEG